MDGVFLRDECSVGQSISLERQLGPTLERHQMEKLRTGKELAAYHAHCGGAAGVCVPFPRWHPGQRELQERVAGLRRVASEPPPRHGE